MLRSRVREMQPSRKRWEAASCTPGQAVESRRRPHSSREAAAASSEARGTFSSSTCTHQVFDHVETSIVIMGISGDAGVDGT
jgi:hypothetical protein